MKIAAFLARASKTGAGKDATAFPEKVDGGNPDSVPSRARWFP
jgi:hypothetical protein